MKTFKKIMALVIAMVMVLGMSTMAMADTQYTVASPSEQDVVTGHSYKAYQIFTATSYDSTSQKFGNLAFSSNVADAAKTALLGSNADVDELATSLGANDSAAATAFAKTAYAQKANLGSGTEITSGTTTLSRGLWLIVDETTATSVDVINWANLFVATADDSVVTVVSKVDAPESDKKIKETDDTAGTVSDWQDAADYDIGDTIPFKLTATLPGNYTDYTTYHLTFHDVEGGGLDFVADSVVVYLGATGTTTVDKSNYTLKTSDIGTDTFQVIFTKANLDAIGVTNNSVIRVEYNSVLNETGLVYGRAGNPNTSWITYDNNPNSEQDGEEGGKTPDDTVIAFTYKTDVDKIKGGVSPEEKLAGAGFTLYKKVTADYNGAALGSSFTFNTGVERSAIVDTDYYVIVSNVTEDAANGDFTFNGVDDGTYVLVETTVPAGYNAWQSKTVVVNSTYTANNVDIDPATGKVAGTETYVLTALADDGNTFTTVDTDLSTLNAKIENNQGSTLPSTGGIGTTIFYVIGAILVLGAGILLVSKRRMSAN